MMILAAAAVLAEISCTAYWVKTDSYYAVTLTNGQIYQGRLVECDEADGLSLSLGDDAVLMRWGLAAVRDIAAWTPPTPTPEPADPNVEPTPEPLLHRTFDRFKEQTTVGSRVFDTDCGVMVLTAWSSSKLLRAPHVLLVGDAGSSPPEFMFLIDGQHFNPETTLERDDLAVADLGVSGLRRIAHSKKTEMSNGDMTCLVDGDFLQGVKALYDLIVLDEKKSAK